LGEYTADAGLLDSEDWWSINDDDVIDEKGKFDIDDDDVVVVVVVVVEDVVVVVEGGVGVLFISQNIFSKSLINVSS
jgi:hypothetical protein